MDWLIPLVTGFCDRVRGGFPDDTIVPVRWHDLKHIAREVVKFSYGAALIAPIATEWWQYLVASVTWKFGEQIAGDFGGTFRFISGLDQWVSPLLRVGFLWPLLTAVTLGPWNHLALALIPAMMVATFLAPMMAVLIGNTPKVPTWVLELQTEPAWQEFLRGKIVGLLMVLVSCF